MQEFVIAKLDMYTYAVEWMGPYTPSVIKQLDRIILYTPKQNQSGEWWTAQSQSVSVVAFDADL
jgi:hypothetical protein